MNKTKVVILCGGKGYRLKEETEFRPKPMIEIGGMPILCHIMKIYGHYGFKNFIIALGYKGNLIKDYFVNKKYYDGDFTLRTGFNKISHHKRTPENFNITFVDTGIESLTGERIRRIKNYIKESDFMLTYGDGVADIDIAELYRYHKRINSTVTVTGVYPMLKYGIIDSSKHGLATSFERQGKIRHLINGGFMVLKKNVFDLIKPDSMIESIFDPLIEKKQLAVYEHKGFFHAMDTHQDMQDLNTMWDNGPSWKVWA